MIIMLMKVVKKYREQLGLTQAELANKTSLSLRTIQRLESASKPPKGHSLKKLCEVFEISPEIFQSQFNSDESMKQSEKNIIKFINLSILSFIGVPFGNIIFPIILWYRYRKLKYVDEIGKRIINFQIIWWLVLALLLSISPFISRTFLSGTQIILYVLFIGYVSNVIIVYGTAMKLERNNFNVLDVAFRFL